MRALGGGICQRKKGTGKCCSRPNFCYFCRTASLQQQQQERSRSKRAVGVATNVCCRVQNKRENRMAAVRMPEACTCRIFPSLRSWSYLSCRRLYHYRRRHRRCHLRCPCPPPVCRLPTFFKLPFSQSAPAAPHFPSSPAIVIAVVNAPPLPDPSHSHPFSSNSRHHRRRQASPPFIRRFCPYARKSASQAVLSRMQLTLHATRPNTSRRFALGASNVCLIGENQTCSVPTL